MPTLHVRNVPQKIYRRVSALAQSQRRSLSGQVITLLEEALADRRTPPESMPAILDRIRARREGIRLPRRWPGSDKLLADDRAR